MADIRMPLGGLAFSVRVGIICVRDGRLLANRQDGLDYAWLPGGALGTGEDALACAAREWREETGTEPGATELVGIVENFFVGTGGAAHEIGFYVRMTAPDEVPEGEFPVADAPDGVLTWVPLGEVAAYPVLPHPVAELITVPSGVVRHLVRRSSEDGIP